VNFDIDFSGGTSQSPGFVEDVHSFPAYSGRNNTGDVCLVEPQYFGVVLRANYTIPENGVYRFRIGSDDGSSLRVEKIINGNPDPASSDVVHDNWSGGKTYYYHDNIINSYREYEAGEELR